MASSKKSRDSLERKVNEILRNLPEWEDPLGRSIKEEGTIISERNIQMTTLERNQSALVPKERSLRYHLRLLKLKLGKLEQLQTNVGEELDKHLDTVQFLFRNHSSRYLIKPELEGMEKKIFDLLYQVPFLSAIPEKQKAATAAYGNQDDEDEVYQEEDYFYLPGIHSNVEDLIKCEAFRQVEQKFKELEFDRMICLLSFAVFPENREVHRTMLMYWWIGEGILPVEGAEETVREILKDFTHKNLVEPVEERRKVAPSSYKMNPFVHSSVILLSEAMGLFDIYHEGKKPRMKQSEKGKVCLVEGSLKQPEANPKKMPSREHIKTVFNVSERYPEFAFKWFSEQPSKKKLMFKLSKNWFKSLKVFYLGRWERSKKRRIQLQSPQLMQCLKHLTNLRLLSFQGISAIRSLNRSVCKLNKLIILDLRECYDLIKLPEKIESLRNLVYLDMTGCYMLEWIPLRLALLKNLEVLKGFVVSDEFHEGSVACKLNYLKELNKLRKLSIEINRDDLGIEQVMKVFVEHRALTSLKVTWRRTYDGDSTRSSSFDEYSTKPINLPDQLKKLDMQRFPHKELPIWLHPQNLRHLKTLHIGGASTLKSFGDLPEKATHCSVEILRLTSLPKLRVGWMELKQIYFPNLSFLENTECPLVTRTPCDGTGIWKSDQD